MKQRNSAILSYGRTIRKATANDVSLIMDFIRQGRAKIREFGIRKGLKKLVISSKIRIFIGENQ